MSVNDVLRLEAFDDIIASLEDLLLEVQNLVASVDPLNDPKVIADIQELADNLAILSTIASNLPSIVSVEEALPAINAVNGALTAIQSVADALADVATVAGIHGDVTAVAGIESEVVDVAENLAAINTLVGSIQEVIDVAGQLGNIQIVAENDEDITTVAGAIVAVQEVADNIQDVIDAIQAAEDAEQARDDAQTWAEGDDPAVELLGGVHSAKTWAEISEQHTREGIRFLGTVADLDDLPPDPDDGDAYFYSETVGDNAIGYGVVWSESEDEWIIFQMGATLIPGTMLPDQEAAPAAENQTTFGGFSANPAMSLVMINRIEQESDTYTFDGNQIVFNEGLSAGDIVRVRQWRTQVSFEDLPDVETLGAEDKIPVQTSQGSGVVRPINVLTGLYSKYRVEDLLAGNFFGYTEGSGSYDREWSGNANEFFSILTGEDPDSRAVTQYKVRGGYPQGNVTIPRVNFDTERHVYATLDFRTTYPESIVRIVTNRLTDRYGLDTRAGYGIEVRGGRVFVTTVGGSGYQEFDTGYDVPNGDMANNGGNTVFFVISLVNNHITVSANGGEIYSSGDNVPTGIGNQYPQLSLVVDRTDLEATGNVQINVSELKLITERW